MSPTPTIVDRKTWDEKIEDLRAREKAHTREGDAIAAARRRLPMVEVDANMPLIGPNGTTSLLEAFEGRKQLFASFHMWHTGKPGAKQCEGCTFFDGHALELSYLHSRDVTFAIICDGPYEDSSRYRELMGWDMPWYGVPDESRERLLAGRGFGNKACYLRDGDRVFETYWTTGRGCEAMAGSYGMLDMTVYGRQEWWEDSPVGWPQSFGNEGAQFRTMADGSAPKGGADGRPIPQWSRFPSADLDGANGG